MNAKDLENLLNKGHKMYNPVAGLFAASSDGYIVLYEIPYAEAVRVNRVASNLSREWGDVTTAVPRMVYMDGLYADELCEEILGDGQWYEVGWHKLYAMPPAPPAAENELAVFTDCIMYMKVRPGIDAADAWDMLLKTAEKAGIIIAEPSGKYYLRNEVGDDIEKVKLS